MAHAALKNSVNMATVESNEGSSDCNIYIGGLAGYFQSQSSSHTVVIKNCANYGPITKYRSRYDTYIGGIVGYVYGYYKSPSSFTHGYVQNTANYATIYHGSSRIHNLFSGGIARYSSYVYIENCVNGGTIPRSGYYGGVVGYTDSSTYINYCYWEKNSNPSKVNAYGVITGTFTTFTYDGTTLELTDTISIFNYTGTSLVGALNSFVFKRYLHGGYSHLLLNKEKKGASFTVNNTKLSFSLSSPLILLPNFADNDKIHFEGWYTEKGLTTPLTNFEVNKDIELYGKWKANTNSYTITFDTRGGTPVSSIRSQYLSSVTKPADPIRAGCTFM